MASLLDLFVKVAVKDEASSAISGIAGGIKSVMGMATAAIGASTAALTGFAGASVGVGMQFDSAMSQVAATMGDKANKMVEYNGQTVDSMTALRDFAQEMGAKTAFSASQSAQALNYMALAGYDAETSMQMLPNVMSLAAAGCMDLASASDMVTDSQSALNLSLDETAQMVNQMAVASSTTNTSVAQLGEALLTLGGTGAAAKGGTSELATMLGVIADNGKKGAEGGTVLRNMIMSLSSPTKNGTAALEKLGVSLYDSKGNMRSLVDVTKELSAATAGMSQQEKDSILGDIFNKTDIGTVNSLLNVTTERWNEVEQAVQGASDTAAMEMEETQLNNLSGAVTYFKSALEGVQIAISDKVTPTLNEFVSIATNGLGDITSAIKAGDIESAFDAISGIIEKCLSKVVDVAPKLINAGMKLLDAFGNAIIQNAPQILELGIQVVTQLLYGIESAASKIGEAIPVLFGALIDYVAENADSLLTSGLNIVLSIANGIIQCIPVLLQKLPAILLAIIKFIGNGFPQIMDAIIEIIHKLIEGVIASIPNIVGAIGLLLSGIIEAIVVFLGKFAEMGIEIVLAIEEGIAEAWANLVKWFTGIWNDLFGKKTVDIDVNGKDNTGIKSHAIGADYIPYNGYLAELHRGEAVLTAREAEEWRKGNLGNQITMNNNITISGAEYGSPQELAEAVSRELAFMVNRNEAVFGGV